MSSELRSKRSKLRSKISRLPSRFPVGTRYVIEGRGGHVYQQYLEFPDGRQIQLPAGRALRDTPRGPQASQSRGKAARSV